MAPLFLRTNVVLGLASQAAIQHGELSHCPTSWCSSLMTVFISLSPMFCAKHRLCGPRTASRVLLTTAALKPVLRCASSSPVVSTHGQLTQLMRHMHPVCLCIRWRGMIMYPTEPHQRWVESGPHQSRPSGEHRTGRLYTVVLCLVGAAIGHCHLLLPG